MKRRAIPFEKLRLPILRAWGADWFLLTAGTNAPRQYNAMTVGWGSLGVMWSKPFAQVVVRPTRHTYGFLERADSFTLSAFPEKYRGALEFCGGHSGRDVNKTAETGLTPIPSSRVAAPGFAEAELILECRKMYFDDLEPGHFLDPGIESNYNHDYHRVYFGEILAIFGTRKYRL
ncbi:MAG: flavin reductase [Planctomycetota bacterium]